MSIPVQLMLDVVVTRGLSVESRHRVHAAIVDAKGNMHGEAGDSSYVTFWRSSAKPFQVMPLVRDGGLERFKWGEDELALSCASHGGEPEHIAIAARMLASLGLEEGDLACGIHEPLTRRGAQLARDAGGSLTRMHNNCSGKHAAMLARAKMKGWPTAGYELPDHPVQQEARAEVGAWTDLDPSGIPVGVDGCGVSVFALPLDAMARAYARFGEAIAQGTGPAVRVGRAMASRPFLVGGTKRFDTVIAEETGGRVLAKIGAEGVHCLTIPDQGIGLALKVEDGSTRAQHVAVIAALRQLRLLADPITDRLAEFARCPVKNTRGETVGVVEPAVS